MTLEEALSDAELRGRREVCAKVYCSGSIPLYEALRYSDMSEKEFLELVHDLGLRREA